MKTQPVNLIFYVIFTVLSALPGLSAIVINSPTTDWAPINYSIGDTDPVTDQKTGLQAGDLVGDTNHPSFYSQFDDAGTTNLTDGTLAFRVRLNRVKNESKMTFNYKLFVGIDANQDGVLDLFVGVDNDNNGSGQLAIWNPGSTDNDSPSSTTIESTPQITFEEAIGLNYHFDFVDSVLDPAATSYDLDGGGNTDAFISFSFDFSFIVTLLSTNGISIDEKTPLNYVMATANNQANNLNIDINGIDGNLDSDLPFRVLGASSDTITPTGEAVPEPAVMALIGIGGLCLLIKKHLRSDDDSN